MGFKPSNPWRGNSFSLAFSLVELLIVIAIISLLAGLLLPVLAAAKSSARSVKCKSNLHQFGIAQNLYLIDFAAYPLYVTPDPASGTPVYWESALTPYLNEMITKDHGSKMSSREILKVAGIFVCPSYTDQVLPGLTRLFSYGYNFLGLGTEGSSLGLGGSFDLREQGNGIRTYAIATKESEIVSPSELLAIGDSMWGNEKRLFVGHPYILRTRLQIIPAEDHTKMAYKRHARKANMVFCDSHVESLRVTALFSDTSDEALRRWNKDNQPHRERLRAP